MREPDLGVEIAGIKLKNPIMTASGTFGFGHEYGQLVDLRALGAIVVKATTLRPRAGNPPPRLVETTGGILNSIGLENPGVERVITEEIMPLRALGVPIIVNIAGSTLREYREVAKKLNGVPGIVALEVNISCPNVREGGLAFGTSSAMAAQVIRAVCSVADVPVIAKLSPNVTDVTAIARSVVDAGAAAVSLINTLLGMSIDIYTRRPRLGAVVGGLSGPAIKPVALRMVWQVAQAVSVPIIGMGGIMTAEDAVEFHLAGATAVAVGTANFVNPLATVEIISGLAAYLQQAGLTSVRDLIGALEVKGRSL
jgi:dihydroorotate dehydrogenase (NAD+) catalytic subunit